MATSSFTIDYPVVGLLLQLSHLAAKQDDASRISSAVFRSAYVGLDPDAPDAPYNALIRDLNWEIFGYELVPGKEATREQYDERHYICSLISGILQRTSYLGLDHNYVLGDRLLDLTIQLNALARERESKSESKHTAKKEVK